ncbi:RHS repeat-associated core domain-containing protein [Spirosoma sp. SC4-14]|uniref:RHS repeat domain-containing protein n=1 Tax=Spirosoma sp. SC4-14 TaxID=3128900 RepID=UPI0030D61481
MEYLNSSLFSISHPEGRLAQGTTYEYFLTDHLGNIRAVLSPSSSGTANVTQWTEYDPWGMELAALSSGSSTNRDRFNGKENLAEIGNGMLDFGARFYDATIGRWGLIDPLAEKATHWSPYRLGFDNPVSVTDPTGMFEYSNGYTTQDSKDITGAMEFNGVFQNGGGDGPGKGQANVQQPQPGRLAQTAQERQQQSQAQYEQLIKRGDAIEADHTIESTFITGAIFKPITSIFGRFLGAMLGRYNSGFTPIEKAIIQEAKQIMSNEKLLQSSFKAGVGTELNIAGRTIIVEPSAPLSGMTLFEEKAFVIGKEAFSSKTELTKTILHELYRLHTSTIKFSGASQAVVSQETSAAANFADRAISVFK